MAKNKKQESDVKRVKVEVRHDFNNDEWKEKTNHLTVRMKTVELREEAVKAAAATAKAEIKEMKAEVNDLANSLRNGYELRTVEATCEFNRKKGSKKFYYFAPGNRELNGTFIKEEAMTEADFAELPLETTPVEQPKGGSGELEDALKKNQVSAETEETPRVKSSDEESDID